MMLVLMNKDNEEVGDGIDDGDDGDYYLYSYFYDNECDELYILYKILIFFFFNRY